MVPSSVFLSVCVLVATLGQFSPAAVWLTAASHGHEPMGHTAEECTCEAGEHDPMCPMHKHLAGGHHGIGAGDGSCHIRVVTQPAVPWVGLIAVPKPRYTFRVPARTQHGPATTAYTVVIFLSADTPPPRS